MREAYAYFKALSQQLVSGCRKTAHDGTILFTPDGMGNYDALWTRDFAYMAEYAPEMISDKDLKAAINYIINGRRGDGWIPDRVYADGTPVYAAGFYPNHAGLANLDNAAFLAILVDLYMTRTGDKLALQAWKPYLIRGLNIIPLSENGLVYNDPQEIHSPYGFTDIIGKSGELLMESLLMWRGAKVMSKWYSEDGATQTYYFKMASMIEEHLMILWDEVQGGFMAANRDCRQWDIWGNAYAVYIGFPLSGKQTQIIDKLIKRYNNYILQGQVRHLEKGTYWQRLLLPEVGLPETYQNGAYWATATGWVAYSIANSNKALAKQMIDEVMASFKTSGVYECINTGGYAKLDTYVVSATNIYGAVQRML